jgi:tRNA-dihydrouridine synthase
MIGRGAYGRPWFPGEVAALAATGVAPRSPRGQALVALIQRHYEAILDHYDVEVGLRCARKHLGWYADRLPASARRTALRRVLLAETRPAEVLRLIPQLFDAPDLERVAA